jgi:hypothetical protein
MLRVSWGVYGLVVAIASVLASFTDWLFMGVLFHDRYLAAPEMWRFQGGSGQPRLIVYSQLVGVLSCGSFAYLCIQLHALTLSASLTAAVIVWLAGPVVVIAQMVMWTKLHPLVGASQAVGWLVRFIVTGVLCDYAG